MEKELILLKEYCGQNNVEMDFIFSLVDEGLLEVRQEADQEYLLREQLRDLEFFSRLHYDLSVNVPGIDIIHNLLDTIHSMHKEMNTLRRKLGEQELFLDNFFEEL